MRAAAAVNGASLESERRAKMPKTAARDAKKTFFSTSSSSRMRFLKNASFSDASFVMVFAEATTFCADF